VELIPVIVTWRSTFNKNVTLNYLKSNTITTKFKLIPQNNVFKTSNQLNKQPFMRSDITITGLIL